MGTEKLSQKSGKILVGGGGGRGELRAKDVFIVRKLARATKRKDNDKACVQNPKTRA